MFKKEKPGEAGHIHPFVLALSIMSAEGIPTRWLDLDGVQERPQSLSKGCGKDFGRKVSDVGRDFSSCQELRHFVTKGVAVMFKEVIRLSSEHGFSQ